MRLNILEFLLLPLSLTALSLEEKVGQLLIVSCATEEEAKQLIEEAHVGGFIYYSWANDLETPVKVKHLSKTLQNMAKIPLWICIDQEGGPVTRLGKGFPKHLGNRELGETRKPELAKKEAFRIGKTLHRIGINMNLAPVVDVSLHPESSFMTKRTYGDDPETVTAFAKQALLGYDQAGILAVLKHFPGCGDVAVDPHRALPFLNKSREELEQAEWVPFRKLAPLAKGIMTTHLMVPALDPQNCATFSQAITTILRREWNYQGLILSDSLVMQGLFEQCSTVEEAAIRALEAGCDLLLLGGRQLDSQLLEGELRVDAILRIHKAIVEAVTSGRVPLERIEDSVKRNLHYKREFIVLKIL